MASAQAPGISEARLVGTMVGKRNFIAEASCRPSGQDCWGRGIAHRHREW